MKFFSNKREEGLSVEKMGKSKSKSIDVNNLGQIQAGIKTGQEPLTINNVKLPFKLLDFWKWSASDLVSNATRGVFAEYIVATATNANMNVPRAEWDAYDLLTPDGIKIEVKSAAYIQTWAQKTYSKISFAIKQSHVKDAETEIYSNTIKRDPVIYVFCLLNTRDEVCINPLDMEQWEFFIITTKEIDILFTKKKSVSLKLLQEKNVFPVKYPEIYKEIKRKASQCI